MIIYSWNLDVPNKFLDEFTKYYTFMREHEHNCIRYIICVTYFVLTCRYLIRGTLYNGLSFTAYTYAGELPSCAFGFNGSGMVYFLLKYQITLYIDYIVNMVSLFRIKMFNLKQT